MGNTHIKRLVLSAFFLALGFVLPLLTGQIPAIGRTLLPMHIPVFLCAFFCTWRYAVPMAFSLPLLRALLFGRPVPYPDAVAIAFELAAYALVAGVIYAAMRKRSRGAVYLALAPAMVAGRVVRAVLEAVLLGLAGTPFVIGSFFYSIVLASIPGIILQLVLLPAVMLTAEKYI